MLNYLCSSVEENVTDEATQRLHDCVQHIKTLPEVRANYMTLEDYIYYERKDALKEGKEMGRREMQVENILELLADYGDVPDSVREKITAEESEEQLAKWFKLASRVTSVEEFVEKM